MRTPPIPAPVVTIRGTHQAHPSSPFYFLYYINKGVHRFREEDRGQQKAPELEIGWRCECSNTRLYPFDRRRSNGPLKKSVHIFRRISDENDGQITSFAICVHGVKVESLDIQFVYIFR